MASSSASLSRRRPGGARPLPPLPRGVERPSFTSSSPPIVSPVPEPVFSISAPSYSPMQAPNIPQINTPTPSPPPPPERSSFASPGPPPKLGIVISPRPSPIPPPPLAAPPPFGLSRRPKLSLFPPSQTHSNPNLVNTKPTLSLSLAIPKSPRPRASMPSLRLNIAPISRRGGGGPGSDAGSGAGTSSGSDFDDDDEGGYYGKPIIPRVNQPVFDEDDSTHISIPTIMAPHHSEKTLTPHRPGMTMMPSTSSTGSTLDDVRQFIDKLDQENSGNELSDGEGGGGDRPNDRFTGTGGERSLQTWDPEALEELGSLGEGAGGAVYKVRDRRSGRIMARKAIPATNSTPPRQLLRELSFLSTCLHENITSFYGAYISPPDSGNGSEVSLLMEYCEGGSLDGVSRQIKKLHVQVGEKVVRLLALGILEGLAYLHGKKIVHRDIKPSNIVLTRKGVPKLCDFGVSGELVDSVAGTFTGTGYYMAPERISGQPYSIRSDVWSTGLSLLEFAQSRFPYPPDLGPIEMLTVIVHGPVPALEDNENITWSNQMKDFIRVCLMVDPSARPSPREMLRHPWILEAAVQKVSMKEWIRVVWGWEKPLKTKSSSTRKKKKAASSMDLTAERMLAGLSLESGF